ncbi:hypothetical protein N7478_013261 [Penicillium angulare]|uniref:uncharacterized protein n=1 Tax=Penicillium angulare TaxID=116970 RepID=UPI002540266F|nr:uncharacterized protein N7478_013261 [Penicillium angulare]KAJ5257157.1 hypothetical protein N7478_013261 [Penicillium angulare]
MSQGHIRQSGLVFIVSKLSFMHTESSSPTSSSLSQKETSPGSALCNASNKKDLEDEDEKNLCNQNSLPPIDGGFQAWMFLAASTMVEALVWGFAFSFGVFESYYRDNDQIKGSSMVAVIGTCATVRTNSPSL